MHNDVCPVCDGLKVSGKTTFTVDLGESLVVVRNVPAKICEQYGEEWLADKTVQELEHIVSRAKQEHRQFEVLSLA